MSKSFQTMKTLIDIDAEKLVSPTNGRGTKRISSQPVYLIHQRQLPPFLISYRNRDSIFAESQNSQNSTLHLLGLYVPFAQVVPLRFDTSQDHNFHP